MLNIAVLGYGNIGSGAIKILTESESLISRQIGDKLNIKYILELRDCTGRPFADRVVDDINTIVSDPEVDVVAEMLGGLHPAYDYSKAALEAGKSVVTSNKQVVADKGDELTAIANAHGVRYLYEASVGGGIPVIRSLSDSLEANDITEIDGILNGTTNYILTEMEQSQKTMAEALAEAQSKGYAERDPKADISGMDSCRKICILAAIAFGSLIDCENVSCTGIENVTPEDIKKAAENGSSIKLIARAKKLDDGKINISVAPTAVVKSNPLAGISGVYNGILIRGGAVGDVMLYGMGAGQLPTASAVVADIIDIAKRRPVQPRCLEWKRDDSIYSAVLPESIESELEMTLGKKIY